MIVMWGESVTTQHDEYESQDDDSNLSEDMSIAHSEDEGASTTYEDIVPSDEQMEDKEVMLQNEMNEQQEDADSEVLHNEQDSDDEDFFDNNDDEIIETIENIKGELQNPGYQLNMNENNQNKDAVSDQEQETHTEAMNQSESNDTNEERTRYNHRPQRLNAGQGRTLLEPTFGGQEHF